MMLQYFFPGDFEMLIRDQWNSLTLLRKLILIEPIYFLTLRFKRIQNILSMLK